MQRTWTRWLWLLPLLLAFAWAQWNGYQGLSEQDAHDYFRVAKEWRAWLQGGPVPGSTEHPQAYPLLGALLSLITSDVLWAMRLIPLLSFVLLGWCLQRVLRRAHPNAQQLNAFTVLTIGASPFLLRHALVAMSDLPTMAMIMLAYMFAVQLHSQHTDTSYGRPYEVSIYRKWLLVLCACGAIALALATRFAAAPVAVVLLAFLVLFRVEWRTRIGLLVSIAVIAAVGYFFISADRLHHLFQGSPLTDWSPLNWFRRELHSDDGVFSYTFPNILYVCSAVVHPGLLPIGLLLLPFVRRDDLRSTHVQVSVCMAVTYLLFIAGMPFQNDRVLLLAQPFIAIPLFPAFTRAWAWLQAKNEAWPRWSMAALFLLQMGLFARAVAPFIRKARTEREVVHAVEQLHPTDVYTHGMGGAINSYAPGPVVVELWYAPIDTFRSGALVVIRPQGLEEQWHGLPPAINWQRIQHQGVERLAELPDGWELYRLR